MYNLLTFLDILEVQRCGLYWQPTSLPITHVDVKCPMNFSPFCNFAPKSPQALQPTDHEASIIQISSDDESDAEDVPNDMVTVDQLDANSDGSITVPDDVLVPSPFQTGSVPKIQPTVVPQGVPRSYPMGNCINIHRRPDGTFGLNRDRNLYVNPLVSNLFFVLTYNLNFFQSEIKIF